MALNGYNAYNYPYQQSSAQQYPAYQTAPSNVAQPTRQYQQPATTQSNDYMSYPTSAYNGQNGAYRMGQDGSWSAASNYGNTPETACRAAEVLRNMSITTHSTHSASASHQTGCTETSASATNTHSNQYASHSSRSPQAQAQRMHANQATHDQSQARPRSVNKNQAKAGTNRGSPLPAAVTTHPSQQRTQAIYNQQQQRSASPAQPQYSAAPVNASRNATVNASVPQQYNDYSRQQSSGVATTRTAHNAAASTYGCADTTSASQQPGPIAPPPPPASVPDSYNAQSATTVDPMAVYDPWPEYQRKQEVLRAQKAIEDAARAEEERKAEERRQEEERKRQEEEERTRLPKPKSRVQGQSQAASVPPATADSSAAPETALEAEIRAMMAKIWEFNSKDPALLTRIWEDERRAKASRSPTVQETPSQAPATTQEAIAVAATTTSATPVANSRKKTTPREPANNLPKPATPATSVSAHAIPSIPQSQAPPNRTNGNTIWPAEKKANLANAAVTFLRIHNPHHTLDTRQFLTMLDDNPSYIDLCSRLEQMGLKLDRAAFAKNLLTHVPDVNSASRRAPPSQLAPVGAQKPLAPAAVLKKEIATPATAATPQAQYDPAAPPPFPTSTSTAPTPALVAEMIPIKPELKPPANKEEAARKRNLSELVDLTLLSDDDNMGPPSKKFNTGASHSSPYPPFPDGSLSKQTPTIANFPTARASVPPSQMMQAPMQAPPSELRHQTYVQPLEKKKALRRNNYNPATIARDVLLACGRHPTERQLNQHLDSLRVTLTQISFESDLSTIRWDLIDPGNPPPGYFKDTVQTLIQDADDEEDSDEEDRGMRAKSHTIGGDASGAGVQALPEAINPFKHKRRGRPSRPSLPGDTTTPSKPQRSISVTQMSASESRPTSGGGVGYRAFTAAVEYGPDGQPLPKKRGRPKGWRKAIHGSPAAQARPNANGHTSFHSHRPAQPSDLRQSNVGGNEPIRVSSRSPSVAHHRPRSESYKCKWQRCSAELHNLETLHKHVFKVHLKVTFDNTLECLWDDCGKEVSSHDPLTGMMIERHTPHSFDLESKWRAHIQQAHLSPLSWERGDGPSSGLSDAFDSDQYLSDAQGRQITPRIVVDPDRLGAIMSMSPKEKAGPRGRGRPPKNTQEQEALDAHERLVAQKKRMGGPGMDRGGATLANEKRRRGLVINSDAEDELVDIDD